MDECTLTVKFVTNSVHQIDVIRDEGIRAMEALDGVGATAYTVVVHGANGDRLVINPALMLWARLSG